MARFQKKPEFVDAVRWWPGKDIPDVCRRPDTGGTYAPVYPPHVHTAGFASAINPGDWIVLNERGLKVLCSDIEFRSTYVSVDAEGVEALEETPTTKEAP